MISSTSDVDHDLLALVLAPYKPACRYLLAASVAAFPEDAPIQLEGRGQFSIPSSAYIADTGHFNAVEFIVCMNQLGYVTIAHNVVRRLAYHKQFAAWSLDTFLAKQLPSVLIVKVEAKMRREINPRDFRATMRCHAVRRNGENLLITCSVDFTDDGEGRAEGTALIALTRALNPSPEGTP